MFQLHIWSLNLITANTLRPHFKRGWLVGTGQAGESIEQSSYFSNMQYDLRDLFWNFMQKGGQTTYEIVSCTTCSLYLFLLTGFTNWESNGKCSVVESRQSEKHATKQGRPYWLEKNNNKGTNARTRWTWRNSSLHESWFSAVAPS